MLHASYIRKSLRPLIADPVLQENPIEGPPMWNGRTLLPDKPVKEVYTVHPGLVCNFAPVLRKQTCAKQERDSFRQYWTGPNITWPDKTKGLFHGPEGLDKTTP